MGGCGRKLISDSGLSFTCPSSYSVDFHARLFRAKPTAKRATKKKKDEKPYNAACAVPQAQEAWAQKASHVEMPKALIT